MERRSQLQTATAVLPSRRLRSFPSCYETDYDQAVWVDNWRGRHFRHAMPSEPDRHLLDKERKTYDLIVQINGGCAGCWDVMAWNEHSLIFVECKKTGKGKDSIKPNQVDWLQSALDGGLRPENFAICEWDFVATESQI
jgi:hypothetical protein